MRYEAEIHGVVSGTENTSAPLYYVLIRYFAQDGDPEPELVEEHLMQLSSTGHVRDTEDGPTREVQRDIRAEIDRAARERWRVARAQRHRGDWTGDDTRPAYRDGQRVPQRRRILGIVNADPKGVLARQDVADLVRVRTRAGEGA